MDPSGNANRAASDNLSGVSSLISSRDGSLGRVIAAHSRQH
jgi:hypothetical protein